MPHGFKDLGCPPSLFQMTPRTSVLCMFPSPKHQSRALEGIAVDPASGYKVTGTFGAEGSRTSQHSQRKIPYSSSQMPPRSPIPLLLSSSIPQLGAGGGEWANLPISSAQTLPGPYSGAWSQRVKEMQAVCSLGSPTSQPASGLRPGTGSSVQFARTP